MYRYNPPPPPEPVDCFGRPLTTEQVIQINTYLDQIEKDRASADYIRSLYNGARRKGYTKDAQVLEHVLEVGYGGYSSNSKRWAKPDPNHLTYLAYLRDPGLICSDEEIKNLINAETNNTRIHSLQKELEESFYWLNQARKYGDKNEIRQRGEVVTDLYYQLRPFFAKESIPSEIELDRMVNRPCHDPLTQQLQQRLRDARRALEHAKLREKNLRDPELVAPAQQQLAKTYKEYINQFYSEQTPLEPDVSSTSHLNVEEPVQQVTEDNLDDLSDLPEDVRRPFEFPTNDPEIIALQRRLRAAVVDFRAMVEEGQPEAIRNIALRKIANLHELLERMQRGPQRKKARYTRCYKCGRRKYFRY